MSAISEINNSFIILLLGFRIFGLPLLIFGVSACDHSVPPGPGSHSVQGVFTFPCKPHMIQLDHQVIWQETILTILMELIIWCDTRDRGLVEGVHGGYGGHLV